MAHDNRQGIYVKFSLEGEIIYQCTDPEEMREVMGFISIGNILRAVKIKESSYKYFENEQQLQTYLESGEQYRLAIEHRYTGNIYVSAAQMAKQTGIKAATLDRLAKENSEGLCRVKKAPHIMNPSLKGKYKNRREVEFDWQPMPSDLCSAQSLKAKEISLQPAADLFLMDASRKAYRPKMALLHTEDDLTRMRAGQQCLLLSDEICGEHNCKIQFLDGSISYCRKSQIAALPN